MSGGWMGERSPHLSTALTWGLLSATESGEQDEKHWSLGPPGRKALQLGVGRKGTLCSWLHQSGMEFRPQWTERREGSVLVQTLQTLISYPILADFLNICFSMCCMALRTFLETLNDILKYLISFSGKQVHGAPQVDTMGADLFSLFTYY